MKMTIKEIKEKGEKDDKIKFTGKVKNVYDATELTPEQKAKAKYTFSRQNVMVGDDTDVIKVIISHKSKEVEFGQDIVGKEVEVDGKLSIWEGQINIFGKLAFKEGEVPKATGTSVVAKTTKTSAMPVVVEVREASLKLSMEFWTARIGEKMDESKVMRTADKFFLYLTGKANIQKETVEKVEKKEEEPKELKGKKSEEQVIKVNNVPLINEIMQLKEDHHVDDAVFLAYCDGKDIKELTILELEVVKGKVKETTGEVPF